MSGESWQARVDEAFVWLSERSAEIVRAFRLGEWERYDYDLDVGTLVFSDAERARVIADISLAGSISAETQTWLWGWANPWMPGSVKAGFEPLRALGEEHGFERLTCEKWPATEADGWEVATVAARVRAADLVYRAPTDTGPLFLLLTGVRWVGE